MKSILVIICILLLSLLFSPPSIVARELAAQNGTSGETSKDPPKEAAACGKPGTPAYSNCIAKPKPKHKCKRHNVFERRCGPT
ncbi:hypothetical protein CIPAW_03G022400 [Carya illinoinensis]|uniref:Uncharacterized protein n=1 Tax=Carya illinoinensis TaxID=32201 RepID=A0A8T1QXV5_CARIL|nr:hypothetical protein CIPAW_03G022400 [Carya illinoinensis]